jgi:hypothetical protein
LRVILGRFGTARGRGRGGEFGAAWRKLVLALTLVAFAAQSFVTQTHIHLPHAFEMPSAGTLADKPAALSVSAPRSNSAGDDALTCPFCQEIVTAGQYLSPSAAGAVPPMLAIAIVPIAAYARAERTISSHAWQGRAPPSF